MLTSNTYKAYQKSFQNFFFSSKKAINTPQRGLFFLSVSTHQFSFFCGFFHTQGERSQKKNFYFFSPSFSCFVNSYCSTRSFFFSADVRLELGSQKQRLWDKSNFFLKAQQLPSSSVNRCSFLYYCWEEGPHSEAAASLLLSLLVCFSSPPPQFFSPSIWRANGHFFLGVAKNSRAPKI